MNGLNVKRGIEMDETEKLVRRIFILHGRDRKIPLTWDAEYYDYDENYTVQKLLHHHELRKHIMDEGYTWEQAGKIIDEAELRGIIDLKDIDPDIPRSVEMNEYALTNEEYWVEEEYDSMSDFVIEEILDAEPKEYVDDDYFDREDEDERKLRMVYVEYNEKKLSREELITGLMGKRYTEKEAEQLIDRYTTQEFSDEERRGWELEDRIFKRPKYKPLKHRKDSVIHPREGGKSKISMMGKPIRVKDSYEMMQPIEWYTREYSEVYTLRKGWDYIYRAGKVPFRVIRGIFREAEKRGKKTLTESELKREIMRECSVTEEEAQTAIYGAELTFKIKALLDPLWQMWGVKPFTGEPRYYWSGTTVGYPPFTYQDRIFTLITRTLQEAEAEGRQALTHGELVSGAYKNYEEYRRKPRAIPMRTLEREFVETLIEDAEELQIIIAQRENGEIKYRLNHQIFDAIQKGKQKKAEKRKRRRKKGLKNRRKGNTA
ncbi:MAG: hypothetical protein QXS27_03705 [Candidatus Jordarchaeaceae archaeon]